jgi:hypothetical protein
VAKPNMLNMGIWSRHSACKGGIWQMKMVESNIREPGIKNILMGMNNNHINVLNQMNDKLLIPVAENFIPFVSSSSGHCMNYLRRSWEVFPNRMNAQKKNMGIELKGTKLNIFHTSPYSRTVSPSVLSTTGNINK